MSQQGKRLRLKIETDNQPPAWDIRNVVYWSAVTLVYALLLYWLATGVGEWIDRLPLPPADSATPRQEQIL